MRERDLRRRCRRLLNQLDIRPPLDVVELCRRVGEDRGRPIRLVPHPIPVPGPFGVWITTDAADYIVYQQQTTKTHQGHIVLHELGHILAGHRADIDVEPRCPSIDPDDLRDRYPDLDPDAVRRALHRTSYATEQEREAETVATIILQWASVLDRVAPPVSQDPTARRLGTVLGGRMGWL
ncbi:MAG TPA: hypothetical protein VFV67_12330 [Actinophytocola sp.]|uniref:hypothetical protein n=1 Tax=Actinophytocola sp. TaxID=1872138 RepID=UPI002DBF63AB|nr:hypothetical protein [Actinophytocola sp.]HEU5471433.1 hypothetical protein [Actinophytocola sp.]